MTMPHQKKLNNSSPATRFSPQEFYKNIPISSTEGLPLESKTRSNNLVTIPPDIPIHFQFTSEYMKMIC